MPYKVQDCTSKENHCGVAIHIDTDRLNAISYLLDKIDEQYVSAIHVYIIIA